jgi:hypothetical protein
MQNAIACKIQNAIACKMQNVIACKHRAPNTKQPTPNAKTRRKAEAFHRLPPEAIRQK